MRHGYIQCSRPDCPKTSNYHRKELHLIAELSSDDESQSTVSEAEHQGLLAESTARQDGASLLDGEQEHEGSSGGDSEDDGDA